ncbi:Cyclin G2 [Fasciolopsis buskii]|uniref:Cyclin G2 n=1 Tax=Fasciolopsis buskii TaxID=27845 RepID=A0A8E0RWK9_9TREM|nr:Cyclin G2 [Fasciolopsis buski]
MADQKQGESMTSTTNHTHHVPVPAPNSGSIHISTRCRFGQLRAPKRCIIDSRRVPHRTRRNQRSDSGKSEDKVILKDPNQNASPVPENAKRTDIADTKSMNLGSSPPLTPPGCESSSPSGQSLPDNKRPRPEINNDGDSLDLSVSAPASCMRDTSHFDSYGDGRSHSVIRGRGFSCKESHVDPHRLRDLLAREPHYHPNNAFLFYVNPEVEDKVDAALRNEAVHNLRFMHNAFFNLSTETFCKAVNLIDRFIVKVKVKPKYMACVATASYCAASKLTHPLTEDIDLPSPDTLVHITRCGGNGADLIRMEEILASKLSNDLDGVNAYDFLRIFTNALVMCDDMSKGPTGGCLDPTMSNGTVGASPEIRANTNGSSPLMTADNSSLNCCISSCELDQPRHEKELSGEIINREVSSEDSASASRHLKMQYNQLLKRVMTRLEISLCSLEIYRFRPACLALGILAQTGVTGLLPLAQTCKVDWADVCECASLVDELYEVYYRDPLPSSRRQMVWNLSRRTLFRIGYSSPTPLDTISEDCEPADDDEWLLPLLFEP